MTSIFKLNDESGGWFALTELLKLQENSQFPDEPVNIEGTQIHRGDDRRTSNTSRVSSQERVVQLIVVVYFQQNKKKTKTKETKSVTLDL